MSMTDRIAKARKTFDYIFNTKAALNMAALFADGTEYYRSPAEIAKGENVTLRFRTGADNVDRVYLICNGDRHLMRVTEKDNLFDYYSFTVESVDEELNYYFEIQAGNIICYYNKLVSQ